MPRTKKTRPHLIACAVACVVASATLIGATPEPPFEPLEHVPSGAVAVASVGDLTSLLGNSIGFLRNAGLESVAAELSTLIDGALHPEGGESDAESAAALFKAVDPGRRFVAAVYQSDGGRETAALLFLPLRSALGDDARLALERAAGAMGGEGRAPSVATDYPGYALIRSDGEAIPAYGSGGTMSLGSLAAQAPSSLAVWIDPSAVAALLGSMPGGLGSMLGGGSDDYGDYGDYGDYDDYEYSDDAIDNTGIDNTGIDNTGIDNTGIDDTGDGAEYAEDYSWDEPVQADDQPGYDDMAALGEIGLLDDAPAAVEEALKAGLEELTGLEVTLTVQPDRAWLRVGVELAPDGTLAELAASASSGDRTLPYLSYCDADALMSFAWSAPYDWSLPLLEGLYALILPEGSIADDAIASVRAYAKASGLNGGVSIGLDPSSELIQAIRTNADMDDAETLELVSRGLGLTVGGAMELRDRQAFRDAMAEAFGAIAEPEYAELMEAAGMSMSVDRGVGVASGMPYDAYRYEFAYTDVETADSSEVMAMELLGRLMAPVMVYSDDKAFIGLGDPKAVAAGLAKDGAARQLRTDKAFKALRAGASADTRALTYVSTRNLVRLLLRMMPEDQEPLGFNAANLSGLLMWLDATPATLGFGLGLGAEDVKAVVTIAN